MIFHVESISAGFSGFVRAPSIPALVKALGKRFDLAANDWRFNPLTVVARVKGVPVYRSAEGLFMVDWGAGEEPSYFDSPEDAEKEILSAL